MCAVENLARRSYRGYGGEHRTRWHATIRRSFERAAAFGLVVEDIPENALYGMLNDLGNVVQFRVSVDGAVLSRFFDRLMEIAVSTVEQGDQLRQTDFVAVLDAAIPRLEVAGLPVWPVHLANASYHSRQDKGGTARRAALELARRSCTDARASLEVGLATAQHDIDVGRYANAHRLLSRCERACSANLASAEQWPQVYVCYGNLYYVQGALRKALSYYQAALSYSPSEGDLYRRARSEARACHYIGKILHELGNHEEALRYLIRALKFRYLSRSEYARKSGFYHIAIGDILITAKSLGEAEYHLAEARRTFARLRENTVAHAILDAAAARLAMRLGHADEARSLLDDAVRGAHAGGYRRGMVLFEIQRFALCLQGREWGAAWRSGRTAVRTWIRFLQRGNRARAAFGAVEFAIAFLKRNIFQQTKNKTASHLLVRCPCEICRSRRATPAAAG
jgi:tetratricopeptide (TPR) repeat protein